MKILLFNKKNPDSQESFESKKRTPEPYNIINQEVGN